MALAAMLAFSALCIFCVLRGFVELHPEKDMYPVEEGIRVSPSKNADLNIIRYEWIEVVVMNEAGGGSVYVDIFFTADGKKYIYRTFQRKIKDHGEFLEALREKGVDVRVLEPSIWVQRKRDFTWIGYMMKGREWVR